MDAFEEELKKGIDFKTHFNTLKELHGAFGKTALRNIHKTKLKERFDKFFTFLKEQKQEKKQHITEKRIRDLHDIIQKMEKSLEWNKRELNKHLKLKQNATQVFQLKLIETKISMIEEKINELESKLASINKTYRDLKEQV